MLIGHRFLVAERRSGKQFDGSFMVREFREETRLIHAYGVGILRK